MTAYSDDTQTVNTLTLSGTFFSDSRMEALPINKSI